MFVLLEKLKKRINDKVPEALYEDYRKTCVNSGKLPLTKEEYTKRFNELSKRKRSVIEDE